MAAPASSSTSAAVSPYSLHPCPQSDQVSNLLKTTPEELKKKGFDGKPWAIFLEDDFLPWHKECSKTAYHLTSDF